jgi:molybdopterin-synthase adenylyltransferase
MDLTNRYIRQSFIGDQNLITEARIAVVGLGGGGSAMCTQLAHLGFRDFVTYDPNQRLMEKHLNRTFGATYEDVISGLNKIQLAQRTILKLQPEAKVKLHQSRWQENPQDLQTRDIVFGCVDGLAEREQLETFCRRNLISYIDIGLGVVAKENQAPYMSGQVILSLPGQPCMKCLGFINDEALAREAGEYGDAGDRPQVIWGNSVLAGAAVGIAIKLITGWHNGALPKYLQYDGNLDELKPHRRLNFIDLTLQCPHFLRNDVGESRLLDI